MYPWNIIPICIHIERINSTSTQKGINMVLCKKNEMLFAKHMFKRIIFIITPVISIMNRNSSRDIQTSLSMMTPDIQSLSITHHFICIVVTDSVVKAKNHCRRRHHHQHHQHHHWLKICVQMLLIMTIFQTLTRFHQMVWKYGFLIRLRCVMKGRNEKIPLRYNSHWNHRLRCHRKMNWKIPLYHIFIEFANSVDKAQSPLYFCGVVLSWINSVARYGPIMCYPEYD